MLGAWDFRISAVDWLLFRAVGSSTFKFRGLSVNSRNPCSGRPLLRTTPHTASHLPTDALVLLMCEFLRMASYNPHRGPDKSNCKSLGYSGTPTFMNPPLGFPFLGLPERVVKVRSLV